MLVEVAGFDQDVVGGGHCGSDAPTPPPLAGLGCEADQGRGERAAEPNENPETPPCASLVSYAKGRMQAVKWSAASERNGGGAASQASCLYGQRGAKRQPRGISSAPGTDPAIVARRWRRGPRSGIAVSNASVYGCSGASKIVRTGASSAARPAYSTRTRSVISAITPRSWVIRI